MTMPFSLEALRLDQQLCDREQELQDLVFYAEHGVNVVLHGPRRTGKTSLAHRVQQTLAASGVSTARVDFSRASSVEEVARLIIAGLLRALYRHETGLERLQRYAQGLLSLRPAFQFGTEGELEVTLSTGLRSAEPMELFTKAVDDFARLVRNHTETRFFFVWDEFQEITRLKESAQLEAVLRAAIEGLPAAFLFLGSRRSILQAMFQEKGRMLFRSGKMLTLDPLPEAAMLAYLRESFQAVGHAPPAALLQALARASEGHAYYLQHLAVELLRQLETRQDTAHGVDETILPRLVRRVMASEEGTYAALIQGLNANQLQVLKAVAAMPGARVMGQEFVLRAKVGATSARYVEDKLRALDLIEKDAVGGVRVVDPFFARWLLM